MKLTEHIHLVGGGAFGLSCPGDGHVYALHSRGETVLIDSGLQQNPIRIIENLKNDGIAPQSVRFVLLTHAHGDHAAGAQYFQEHFGAQIACSPAEAECLRRGAVAYYGLEGDERAAREWGVVPPVDIDVELHDGQEISVGGLTVCALHTPGHSPGSVCYLLEEGPRQQLFSGDTVFYKGFINLLAHPFSNHAAYRDSILKLGALLIDGLFPGHLLFTLGEGQAHIEQAAKAYRNFNMPVNKPFS